MDAERGQRFAIAGKRLDARFARWTGVADLGVVDDVLSGEGFLCHAEGEREVEHPPRNVFGLRPRTRFHLVMCGIRSSVLHAHPPVSHLVNTCSLVTSF